MDARCRLYDTGRLDVGEHNRQAYRVYNPLAQSVFIHSNCLCNQITALRNRVLCVVPTSDVGAMLQLKKWIQRLARRMPRCYPISSDQFLSAYTGSKLARYTQASESLKRDPVTKRDAQVTMFVKRERILLTDEKPDPAPRAIQYRNARYGLELGCYLKPIEHMLYSYRGDGKLLPPDVMVAKGMNSYQRAEAIARKLARFRDPAVLQLDVSRFDQCVSREALIAEHALYQIVTPDPKLRQLLSWQLTNYGRSSAGVKYVSDGRRMSGDMNTALGNCVLMIAMLSYCCRGYSYDILDDGDDALLFVELADADRVAEQLQLHYRRFGFNLKVESIVSGPDMLHRICFCQARVVALDSTTLRMVRDYRKVFRSLTTSEGLNQPLTRATRVAQLALCELALSAGVPVLQSYCLALLRSAVRAGANIGVGPVDVSSLFDPQLRYRYELDGVTKAEPCEITQVARLSYAVAFECPIPEQLALEQYYDQHTFDLGDPQGVQELSRAFWSY